MTATANTDHARLRRLLHGQHGVIARGQALECGLTDVALRHRTRPGGRWQTVLPGVYLTQSGPPSDDQRDMAALLYAGAGAVITGCAALRRLGLRAPRIARVDVLIPAARRCLPNGFVRVLRTSRMPGLVCADGRISFALAARAVADAARGLDDLGQVRALVAEAVQSGWCRVTELAGELAEGPGAGSARLRRVLAEVADGVRSAVEGEFRDLVIRAGLPLPMFNARLYAGTVLIGVVDAWWPAAGVAVEVDSREWHLSPGDWERTIRRHARLTAQGILVLHFTPRQIRTEPAQVVAAVRAALDAGQRAGQPAVRALPATA